MNGDAISATSADRIAAPGPFLVWTSDGTGKALSRPLDDSRPHQDPSVDAARQIIFSPNSRSDVAANHEELALCHKIDGLLYTLNHFYSSADPAANARFRRFYSKIFDLAREALETRDTPVRDAASELRALEDELLLDEWADHRDAARHLTNDIAGGLPPHTEGGPLLLWTATGDGRPMEWPLPTVHPEQDRWHPHAHQIFFSLNPHGPAVTPADMEFRRRVETFLDALCELRPADRPARRWSIVFSALTRRSGATRQPPGTTGADFKYRLAYVSAFGIARLALETRTIDLETADKELDIVEQDLVHDMKLQVKTNLIKAQAVRGAVVMLGLLAAYALWPLLWPRLPSTWWFVLGVTPWMVQKVLLLLAGCVLGVCLSRALTKREFERIDDLVAVESDLFSPWVRLIFVAAIAVVFVMFSAVGFFDLEIVDVKLSEVLAAHGESGEPMPPALPFAAGVLFGILDKALPTTLLGKVSPLAPVSK